MTLPPPYKTRMGKTRQPSHRNVVGLQPIPGGIGARKNGPQYRGKETQKRKDSYDLMRQLSLACKYLTEKERASVEEIAAGTQLFWRDVVFQLLTGRFWYIVNEEGERYFSMASKAEVSLLLDTISQAIGTLMYRGPNLWEPLLPGGDGQFLTSQGEGLPPIWTAGGGGTGIAVTTVKVTADQTETTAWPKYVAFDTELIDQNGSWSGANPDRLYLPAGASLVRLSAAVRITSSTGIRPQIVFSDQTDTIRWDIGAYSNQRDGTTGFSNNNANLMGPWIPIPAGIDYLRLRINNSSATNGAALADTFATIEAM